MLFAETAVLLHFQAVRIVLLVLLLVVVALLALGAGQGNFDSHRSAPPFNGFVSLPRCAGRPKNRHKK